MTDRITRILEVYFFSLDIEFTTDVASVALSEYGHCKLCTSCTLQSGETNNLAFMYFTGNIVIYDFFRIKRMMYGPVLYFQHDIFADVMLSGRITVIHGTANHTFDDTVFA